jgi:ferredoxin
MTLKVKVDPEKCQGHNRCYAMAPGMFKVDEYGYATPRGDGTLTADNIELAQRAVENCPERAISIEDDSEAAPAA